MASNLYEPLRSRQFRLLTIGRGTFNDPIHLKISTHHLDTNLTYKALSYQCGRPNKQTDPVVYIAHKTKTGSTKQETVQIYQNLWSFLNLLRSTSYQKSLLWIDTLSIDQGNRTEKAHQIQVFGDIYRGAKRVLSWLGEHADNSELVFRKPSITNFHTQRTKLPRQCAWAAILKRPYFNRTWIVQEVLLAPAITFFCGSDELSVDDLFGNPLYESFGRLISKKDNSQDIPRSFLLFFARQSQKREGVFGRGKVHYEGWNLFQVAYDYQYTICRDRVDHVYALLALLPRAETPSLPDYQGDAGRLFVQLCITHLLKVVKFERKVTDKVLEYVAMLYVGLRLDKKEKVCDTDDDDSQEHSCTNTERILDMILHEDALDAVFEGKRDHVPKPQFQQSWTFATIAIVRTFDIYGFLKPERDRFITQSIDNDETVLTKIEEWRAQQRQEGRWYDQVNSDESAMMSAAMQHSHNSSADSSRSNLFRVLSEPLWGRYDRFRKQTRSSGRGTSRVEGLAGAVAGGIGDGGAGAFGGGGHGGGGGGA